MKILYLYFVPGGFTSVSAAALDLASSLAPTSPTTGWLSSVAVADIWKSGMCLGVMTFLLIDSIMTTRLSVYLLSTVSAYLSPSGLLPLICFMTQINIGTGKQFFTFLIGSNISSQEGHQNCKSDHLLLILLTVIAPAISGSLWTVSGLLYNRRINGL